MHVSCSRGDQREVERLGLSPPPSTPSIPCTYPCPFLTRLGHSPCLPCPCSCHSFARLGHSPLLSCPCSALFHAPWSLPLMSDPCPCPFFTPLGHFPLLASRSSCLSFLRLYFHLCHVLPFLAISFSIPLSSFKVFISHFLFSRFLCHPPPFFILLSSSGLSSRILSFLFSCFDWFCCFFYSKFASMLRLLFTLLFVICPPACDISGKQINQQTQAIARHPHCTRSRLSRLEC